MSPDDGTNQDSLNPQSMNRYAYVNNNPLKYTDPFGYSTHLANNGEVLAVYKDGDFGVYLHTWILDFTDWLRKERPKLSYRNKGAIKIGETERWDEFAAIDPVTGKPIDGSAISDARIHFEKSLDRLIDYANERASPKGLFAIAVWSRGKGQLDIKTNPTLADYGLGTGYLFQGKYITIRSAGNYLAGLNAMTAKIQGSYISPEFAQKLFGAYQEGGWRGALKTFIIGKEFPGTTGPYWGEPAYSGFYQQKGIEDGLERRK